MLRHYSETGKLNGGTIYLVLNGKIRIKSKQNRATVIKLRKAVCSKHLTANQPANEIQTVGEQEQKLYFNKQRPDLVDSKNQIFYIRP